MKLISSFARNVHPLRRLFCLTLLLLTILCTCGRAQTPGDGTPVGFGEEYLIHSAVLDEDRKLNVLLPLEYADSSAKSFPVIYLLDGAAAEDFFHVAGLVRYYEAHKMMPPTILVGIANTDRYRDMTYPSTDPRDQTDLPTSGGSEDFVKFLQAELPVWLKKEFRTNNHRTLIGQSLAGLLATEVLLKYPGFFQDYIIVSPSLWWDRENLYRQMDSLVAALEDVPHRAFLSAGTEYPVMVDGPRKLARLLKDKTDATFLHLPAEDHNSILHEALNRAFDQWYDPTVIRLYKYANARNGLILRAAPHRDSASVGQLAYGQALGYIPGPEPVADTIEELTGQWVYVGSDVGRGWVFDAWVSPVKVFTSGTTLMDFALEALHLTPSTKIRSAASNKSGHALQLFAGDKSALFIEHEYYEGRGEELQIFGLSESQALVIVQSFHAANGWPTELEIESPWPEQSLFRSQISQVVGEGFYTFIYAEGTLFLKVRW